LNAFIVGDRARWLGSNGDAKPLMMKTAEAHGRD
jgi:hypothetical protein